MHRCEASLDVTTCTQVSPVWESFEPWLSRIEGFPENSLWPLVDQIPSEWYDSATDELEQLLSRLSERRTRVRDLIVSFKDFFPQSLSQLDSTSRRRPLEEPSLQLSVTLSANSLALVKKGCHGHSRRSEGP